MVGQDNNPEKPEINSDTGENQNPDAVAQVKDEGTATEVNEDGTSPSKKTSAFRNLKYILGWGAVFLAGLVFLTVSLVLFLDTSLGHRAIVHYVNRYRTESGINVKLRRIEGSIYRSFRLIDVKAYDQHGHFLDMPSLFVKWRPLDYRYGIITIKKLHAPAIELIRKPELKPTKSDPNAPLLPDIHLDIDQIDLDRIDISKNLDGQSHRLHMRGHLALTKGQIMVKADAGADKGQGISGGDTLSLQFDAKPSANILRLDAHLYAPVGGVVDGLTHLGKPLMMDTAGKGNWQDWRGYIQAQSGDKKLLDWRLHNRNGSIHLEGSVYPAELLADQPSIQSLVKKGLQVDLTTHNNKNIVDIKGAISGEMFRLAALGGIDWEASRFNNMGINLDILNGQNFLVDNLSFKNFAFSSVLSGLIKAPAVDWRLKADQIGWQEKIAQNIQARGKMLMDGDHLSMPMGLSVKNVIGLDPRLANLLENLKIEGAINYGDHVLRVDHSNISSRYIHANTTIVTDLVSKKWRAAIKGGIDSYKVDGVGRLTLAIDSHLQPEKNGELGMAGQMTLTGRDWQKPALKKAFGGDAVLRTDMIANASGNIRMPRFSLISPEFHLEGNGGYQQKGNINLFVKGNSKTYGAMTLNVGGMVSHPLIKANLLGLTVNGSLAQTKNNLYLGQFELNGRGLDGVIRLTEEQAKQAINADIAIDKARFTYGQPIDIESGRLRGKAVFTADPVFHAEALLNNIRYNNYALKQAAARVLYQKGQGEGGLTLQGDLPVNGAAAPMPFNVALHSSFDEHVIRANAQGNIAHLNWHMVAPVEIRSDKNGYDISKIVIQLPKGHIDVSGHYGGQNSYANLQIADIDLSEANLLWPETNLSGQLSAVANADLSGNVPVISARLALNRFTRISVTGLSQPVDLMIAANHDKNGLSSEAVIRQKQNMIGQMRLGITPNYAPEKQHKPDWIEALLKGRLSGGIRYNADADILWSMSGISGQSIRGPLAIAADITGNPQAPVLTGLIRGRSLRYENSAYDTLVSSIDVDGHFDQSKFFLDKMTGKAGKGTLSAKGYASLDAASDYDSALNITLDKATLARADQMKSTVSGNLDITSNRKEGGSVKGKLKLPETRYRFIIDNKESVHELSGVKRKGQVENNPVRETTNSPSVLASAWKLDIRISAPEQLFVAGMGLESEWEADLRVRGTAASPNITGEMRVIRGTYTFAGRRFDIDHGEIQFTGGNPPNPTLDITAEATVDDITATVKIGGVASRPEITFSSSPSLAQDEILSRLLFGSSVTSLSAVQAVQLAAALNTLRTGGKGFDPLDKLRSVIGIDRLRVVGADSTTGQGTSLAAGKYLFKNVYMEVITDTHGFTATQIRISLTRTLSLLSEASSFGSSNVSLRYSKDY